MDKLTAVVFSSDKAENVDRPFGIYINEPGFVVLMDSVIKEFDRVNAIKDKNESDWQLWRNLKDLQFKLTMVHYKWTRNETTETPLPSGLEVDTTDPELENPFA